MYFEKSTPKERINVNKNINKTKEYEKFSINVDDDAEFDFDFMKDCINEIYEQIINLLPYRNRKEKALDTISSRNGKSINLKTKKGLFLNSNFTHQGINNYQRSINKKITVKDPSINQFLLINQSNIIKNNNTSKKKLNIDDKFPLSNAKSEKLINNKNIKNLGNQNILKNSENLIDLAQNNKFNISHKKSQSIYGSLPKSMNLNIDNNFYGNNYFNSSNLKGNFIKNASKNLNNPNKSIVIENKKGQGFESSKNNEFYNFENNIPQKFNFKINTKEYEFSKKNDIQKNNIYYNNYHENFANECFGNSSLNFSFLKEKEILENKVKSNFDKNKEKQMKFFFSYNIQNPLKESSKSESPNCSRSIITSKSEVSKNSNSSQLTKHSNKEITEFNQNLIRCINNLKSQSKKDIDKDDHLNNNIFASKKKNYQEYNKNFISKALSYKTENTREEHTNDNIKNLSRNNTNSEKSEVSTTKFVDKMINQKIIKKLGTLRTNDFDSLIHNIPNFNLKKYLNYDGYNDINMKKYNKNSVNRNPTNNYLGKNDSNDSFAAFNRMNHEENYSDSSQHEKYSKNLKKLNKKLEVINKFLEETPYDLNTEEKYNLEKKTYSQQDNKKIEELLKIKISRTFKEKILQLKRKKIFGKKFNRKENIELLKEKEFNLEDLNNIDTDENNLNDNFMSKTCGINFNKCRKFEKYNTIQNESNDCSPLSKYKLMKNFSQSLSFKNSSKTVNKSNSLVSHQKKLNINQNMKNSSCESSLNQRSAFYENSSNLGVNKDDSVMEKLNVNNFKEFNKTQYDCLTKTTRSIGFSKNHVKNSSLNKEKITKFFPKKSTHDLFNKKKRIDKKTVELKRTHIKNSFSDNYYKINKTNNLKPFVNEKFKTNILIRNTNFDNPETSLYKNEENNHQTNLKKKNSKLIEVEIKDNVDSINSKELNQKLHSKKKIIFANDSKELLDIDKINELIANSEKNNSIKDILLKLKEKKDHYLINDQEFYSAFIRSHDLANYKAGREKNTNKEVNLFLKRKSKYDLMLSKNKFYNTIKIRNSKFSIKDILENLNPSDNTDSSDIEGKLKNILKCGPKPKRYYSTNSQVEIKSESNSISPNTKHQIKIDPNSLYNIINSKPKYIALSPENIEDENHIIFDKINSKTSKNFNTMNLFNKNSVLSNKTNILSLKGDRTLINSNNNLNKIKDQDFNLNSYNNRVNETINLKEFYNVNNNKNVNLRNNLINQIHEVNDSSKPNLKNTINKNNNNNSEINLNDKNSKNNQNETKLKENLIPKNTNKKQILNPNNIYKNISYEVNNDELTRTNKFAENKNKLDKFEVFKRHPNSEKKNLYHEKIKPESQILQLKFEEKPTIDINSDVIKKRMMKTFSSLDNKCCEINKALNLEKLLFKENINKEKMIKKFNEDPELNNLIISNIKENKNLRDAFVHDSSVPINQYVRYGKGASFLDVMEYADKINNINNDTIFKFGKIVLNKVPKFNEQVDKLANVKELRYKKSIEKIKINSHLLENLKFKMILKKKDIIG